MHHQLVSKIMDIYCLYFFINQNIKWATVGFCVKCEVYVGTFPGVNMWYFCLILWCYTNINDIYSVCLYHIQLLSHWLCTSNMTTTHHMET